MIMISGDSAQFSPPKFPETGTPTMGPDSQNFGFHCNSEKWRPELSNPDDMATDFSVDCQETYTSSPQRCNPVRKGTGIEIEDTVCAVICSPMAVSKHYTVHPFEKGGQFSFEPYGKSPSVCQSYLEMVD